ncbi:MAG TPA: hypothetical protein VEM35_09015 [Rhizomicrobium sp.]|nr:hypothetical protein [Rhizomicrobium sp.]
MSDTHDAKRFREAMKAKANRLGNAASAGKVDCSSFGPVEQEPLDSEAKTGMRPISRRAFKTGGAVEGDEAPGHSGRAKRKGGFNDYLNRDLKSANQEREGKKHVGGMKNGGAKKAGGGPLGGFNAISSPQQAAAAGQATQNVAGVAPERMQFGSGPPGLLHVKKGGKVEHADAKEDKKLIKEEVKKDCIKRASGGRTSGKGKMNVNIIIGAQAPNGDPSGGAPGGPAPHLVPPPPPPPPMLGGMPPGGMPPGGMPPGAPPMVRASGGRAYPIEDGAGGGKGRLQKARAYGLKPQG